MPHSAEPCQHSEVDLFTSFADASPLGLKPWGPDIGYIGVLPAHRGRGYAGDLLIEASRLLVEDGAGEIDAMTDVGNAPMAAAFERCGYTVVDRMLVHV